MASTLIMVSLRLIIGEVQNSSKRMTNRKVYTKEVLA